MQFLLALLFVSCAVIPALVSSSTLTGADTVQLAPSVASDQLGVFTDSIKSLQVTVSFNAGFGRTTKTVYFDAGDNLEDVARTFLEANRLGTSHNCSPEQGECTLTELVRMMQQTEAYKVDPKPSVEIPKTSKDGSSPPSALIVYAYHEGSGSLENLRFFLKVGLLREQRYQFLIVMQGCHSVNPPSSLPNVEVLMRENTCLDMGAWRAGVLHMEQQGRRFHHYIVLNGSVRGPFLPVWGPRDWVKIFTDHLKDQVKLVGTTVNCQRDTQQTNRLHLQSMILATDREGMMDHLLPIMNYCPTNKSSAVERGEVLYTQAMLNSGFAVKSMMLGFQQASTTIISLANIDQIMEACDRFDPQLITPRGVRVWDMYGNNQYAGISFHPLEVIFFKTNRKMRTTEVARYTQWALESAGGLGQEEFLVQPRLSAGIGCSQPSEEQSLQYRDVM